jgi:hypothetical protein
MFGASLGILVSRQIGETLQPQEQAVGIGVRPFAELKHRIGTIVTICFFGPHDRSVHVSKHGSGYEKPGISPQY